MHVLIVDDDRIICRCLEQKIHWKELGCDVPDVAYDGEMAVEIIKQRKPDLVISDMKMPVMDGKELCRHLYAHYPEIAFLFISAFEDFSTAQLALECRVQGYVLKPLDGESLSNLEKMIWNVARQRQSGELYEKIISDAYRTFLEKVIEDKDVAALDRLLEQIAEMQGNSAELKADIWQHLLVPIWGYDYSRRNMDLRLLFMKEQKEKEKIQTLSEKEKPAWIRECYLREMDMEVESETGSNVIWEVQEFVKKNFSSPELNVNMLGSRFHMSPVYLGRIFKERTGGRCLTTFYSSVWNMHAVSWQTQMCR